VQSRVGELALRIRTRSSSAEAGELRSTGERFATEVLTRCDAILEERAPGRIYVVRELELMVRLLDRELEDAQEIELLAAQIARAVEQRAAVGGEGDADVAAFENEIAWRVAHVEARPSGLSRELWKFASLDEDDEPLHALAMRDPARLSNVLVTLHARGTLPFVLASASERALVTVAAALGLIDGTEAAADQDGSRAVRAVDTTYTRAALPGSNPKRRLANAVRDAVARAAAHVDSTRARAPDRMSVRNDDDPPVADVRSTPREVESAYGGAFYLLNPAVELSLGGILWRACFPEGLILSHALSLLLGDAQRDDPAAWLCGGVLPDTAVPAISLEQQREVSTAVLAALIRSVPRRGLATLGAPVLRLVDCGSGRLLVASIDGSPFVLFARPAASKDEVAAARAAFLSCWPASAPAPQEQARLQSPPLLVARALPIEASALLTQTAGALAYLFAARVGFERGTSEELVSRYFARPALVVTAPDAIEVRLPMEQIDLDVRRAGLDASPGWIPWLQRRMTLTFVER
jgi:hypothetical protein